MVKAGNLTKGMVIIFKKEPYQVLAKEFFNLGRGRGHSRLKLKNLKTGRVIKQTLNSEEQVKEAQIEVRKAQYLYKDKNGIYFMDQQTFGQFDLDEKLVGNLGNFLKEGSHCQVIFFQDRPITLSIPIKVSLKVIKAEEGVKGDRVSSADKEVVLETGCRLKVPLFIKKGEKIIINTETGEYVSRA